MTDTLHAAAQPVPRDRYGRPMIVVPGKKNPVPYTRATTVAETLDDRYNLELWKMRQVAAGLVARPDLYTLAAAHRDDKQALNRVCSDAVEAAAASAAANIGTALHAFSELVDAGADLSHIPADARADLDAYWRTTTTLEVVAVEQLVVLDDLQVAGTMDRLVRWNGRLVVADLKTGAGAITWGQTGIAVQLALYAHGVGYDPATWKRHDLGDIDHDVALVIHLPVGQATCTLHRVDIAAGWEAVGHALWARKWRKRKDLLTPLTVVDTIEEAIYGAETVDALTRVWADHRDGWTDHHTDLATVRKRALAAGAA